MRFEDACKEVGYDRNSSPPEPIKVWYGYKAGKAVKFENRDLAKTFSENIESVVTNGAEIASWRKNQVAKQQEAIDLWVKILKDDSLDHVSSEVFDICYNRAYERGHSYGYDEVALMLDEEIEFAKRILATKK